MNQKGGTNNFDSDNLMDINVELYNEMSIGTSDEIIGHLDTDF